jgi:polar amino acid transport system substrate-binding protein
LTGEVFFLYQQRVGNVPNTLPPPLVVRRYEAHCAVARRATYSVEKINHAIDLLRNTGVLKNIYAKYQ